MIVLKKQLSKNLSLAEMVRTDTGISNIPLDSHIQMMFFFANMIFQPTRDRFGELIINSGFRALKVNSDPRVSGSNTSQHLLGEAGDIVPVHADTVDVFVWMKANLVSYGQLIFYPFKGKKGVIHASLPSLNKENRVAWIR